MDTTETTTQTTRITSASDLLARYAAGERDFYGATLRGATLSGATLSGAELRGADLRGAELRGAYLIGANLSGANLYHADLRGAELYGAELYHANLRDAYLYHATLSGANLYHADLRGAELRGADLSGATLRDANLPTGSHDVIAELLRRAAGDDIARYSIAGLVLLRRDWCWREFGEIAHTHWTPEMRAWIVATLEPWPAFAPVLRRYGFVDGAAAAEAEEMRDDGDGHTKRLP